uniref:Endonuclease/exonuclease/phosphatase domain-containing protein n=1 Tax=Amphimedon queenslandica TaxID=400682 RepID=A0A1X7T752_AMPQE
LPSPEFLELMTVLVQVPHPVVLCLVHVYLPPQASLIDFLSDLISTHNVILLGDFNFPDIDWSSLSSPSGPSYLFTEFAFRANLSQHITTPTHLREATLQEEISIARSNYEAALVDKFAFSNDSTIYSYIRNLLRSNSLPYFVSFGDKSECSDEVFLPDDASVPFSLQTPAQTLDSIEISIQDVFSALVSLNPSKATGIDGIPARLLKSFATPLCEPIHHLLVQCFAQSYLSLEWKTHLITPIHKSGDKSSVTNYRPISLLCCISNVLEKIIFDKIADFIQPHFVSLQKSSLITFCSVRHSPLFSSYYINGQTIPQKSIIRDLGVIFESDLSWSKHMNNIAAKSYQTIGLLRRAFPVSTPIKTKKLLFLSLVILKLTYCSPIWRPNLVKDITILERVQKRATKYTLNDYSSDYKSRLISLQILPLMY